MNRNNVNFKPSQEKNNIYSKVDSNVVPIIPKDVANEKNIKKIKPLIKKERNISYGEDTTLRVVMFNLNIMGYHYKDTNSIRNFLKNCPNCTININVITDNDSYDSNVQVARLVYRSMDSDKVEEFLTIINDVSNNYTRDDFLKLQEQGILHNRNTSILIEKNEKEERDLNLTVNQFLDKQNQEKIITFLKEHPDCFLSIGIVEIDGKLKYTLIYDKKTAKDDMDKMINNLI